MSFCETCASMMCVCSDVDELGKGYVRVETDEHGTPIRIFRKDLKWIGCPDSRLKVMTKAEAVGNIRSQVWKRTTGECEYCGKWITENTMHMHEELPKGQGGEVSLENSVGICYNCHLGGPTSAHGNRRWHTSKIQEGS